MNCCMYPVRDDTQQTPTQQQQQQCLAHNSRVHFHPTKATTTTAVCSFNTQLSNNRQQSRLPERITWTIRFVCIFSILLSRWQPTFVYSVQFFRQKNIRLENIYQSELRIQYFINTQQVHHHAPAVLYQSKAQCYCNPTPLFTITPTALYNVSLFLTRVVCLCHNCTALTHCAMYSVCVWDTPTAKNNEITRGIDNLLQSSQLYKVEEGELVYRQVLLIGMRSHGWGVFFFFFFWPPSQAG